MFDTQNNSSFISWFSRWLVIIGSGVVVILSIVSIWQSLEERRKANELFERRTNELTTLGVKINAFIDSDYVLRKKYSNDHLVGAEYILDYKFRVEGQEFKVSTTVDKDFFKGISDSENPNNNNGKDNQKSNRRSLPRKIEIIYHPSDPNINRFGDEDLQRQKEFSLEKNKSSLVGVISSGVSGLILGLISAFLASFRKFIFKAT